MAQYLTDITDDTFEQEVVQSSIPVIVDCWAEWCGPCKAMEPFLDQLAGEFQGKVKVVKLDTGVHQKVALQLGITSLPTLLSYKGGQLIEKATGAPSMPKLRKKFEVLA